MLSQTSSRLSGWKRGGVKSSFVPPTVAWFQLGEESVGSEPNVSESLREVGQNPERIVELANSERADRALEAETAEARKLDIFGSPTFVVGKELFWGDDRLEGAISWHKYGRLRRAG